MLFLVKGGEKYRTAQTHGSLIADFHFIVKESGSEKGRPSRGYGAH